MIQPGGRVWDKLRFAVFQVLASEGGEEGFWRDSLLLDLGPCLDGGALRYFPGVGIPELDEVFMVLSSW